MKFKHGDLLGVEWDDAFGDMEPWSLNSEIDVEKIHKVYSVGLFFGESKKYVVICGDVGPGSSGRVLHIPKSMVGKVKKIALSK